MTYATEQVCGYTLGELALIESLYDITLTGQFRAFLLEMGRCDGGLIGDDPIILYRPWSVRTQLLHQIVFFNDMQDAGQFAHLAEKPFTFSCESETQHFFLQTTSATPDRVFQFDENSGAVTDSGLDFLEYMRATVRTYRPIRQTDTLCQGELLILQDKDGKPYDDKP